MKKKIEQLKEAFVCLNARKETERTEWIEADNLDKIRLIGSKSIYKDYLNRKELKIQVENEHGSVFDLEELSEAEINCFLFILPKVAEKTYAHYSSAVRYIKNYEAKHGKQNFVINQLDADCFEVINCAK